MPEGDTVFRVCRALHRALAGQVLTRTDFRVPKLAGADLAGQTVKEVTARGKHILIRTGRGMTLRTHLKMEGTWVLYKPHQRWHGPEFEIRVVLETGEWAAVGYLLAMVDLMPTGDEHLALSHLGPDILGRDWDMNKALERIRSKPEVSIAEALLDQRNLAGIGNLYKNETLFLRGLDPWTRVADVKDLEAVIGLAQKLMRLNIDHAEQATTGSTRTGGQWYVMERPGKPCRRCGSLIQVANQGAPKRLTYWCPSCQGDRPWNNGAT